MRVRRTATVLPERTVQPLAVGKGLSAAVEVAVVVLGLALTGWLTINVWHTGDYDVLEYQQYARAFWLGQPRFTAFPTEYPPLALLPFSLTLVPGVADPRISFALGLSVFFLAGYAGVWRFTGRRAARLYAVYLLVALQSTLLSRYDLIPALAALGASLAARRRHFTLAYALVAVGALLKLYPVALLPIVVIEHILATGGSPTSAPPPAAERGGPPAAAAAPGTRFPNRLRALWPRLRPALGGGVGCASLVAAGVVLPWLRNPSGALSFLSYATGRPIQVESFPATVLWLATFAGVPASHGYAFGSDSYVSPLSDGLIAVLTLATVAGCLAVYALQLAGRLPLERAMLTCVAIVLLGSRVFSTQYVTWALPLAAVAGGDTLVWVAICLLTFADYPWLYPFNRPPYTPAQEASFMAILALRNALLLVVASRALLRPGRTRVLSAGSEAACAPGAPHPDGHTRGEPVAHVT